MAFRVNVLLQSRNAVVVIHCLSGKVASPNIPHLKLSNIQQYSPILETARVAKKREKQSDSRIPNRTQLSGS